MRPSRWGAELGDSRTFTELCLRLDESSGGSSSSAPLICSHRQSRMSIDRKGSGTLGGRVIVAPQEEHNGVTEVRADLHRHTKRARPLRRLASPSRSWRSNAASRRRRVYEWRRAREKWLLTGSSQERLLSELGGSLGSWACHGPRPDTGISFSLSSRGRYRFLYTYT